jgi:predicted  nucleic acid-binding Zn-ribbon protein
MIVKHDSIDEIASRLDVILCDACGAIRMRDREDQDQAGLPTPGEVTAVLLSQVRRDIGNLAGEVRTGFSTLDSNSKALEARIRELELKDAKSEGAIAGIRTMAAALAVACGLVGGFIGWLISLMTKGGAKP